MARALVLSLSLWLLGSVVVAAPPAPAPEPDDPFLWLEEITGEKAMAWVNERNAESSRELAGDRGFARLEARLLAILDSKERIPFVERLGEPLYNFWRDEKNERGLWRRTTLAEYRKPAPAWETVLDLDALARQEKEDWIWKGNACLPPEYRRCLLYLSRGGSDAVVVREFDVVDKAFVPDGFFLPEAKSSAAWLDRDHLFVGTDFGPGSLTASGYPRIIKRWRRGTPLTEAEPVFEGRPEDVSAFGFRDLSEGFERDIVGRRVSFFTSEYFVLLGGKRVHLDVPPDADLQTHRSWLFVTLRSDWIVGGNTYPAGSLLAIGFDDFLQGRRDFATLFAPGPRIALETFTPLRDGVIVNALDNVRTRMTLWQWQAGSWTQKPLPGVPDIGSASALALDADRSDEFFLTSMDFLTPTTLSLGRPGAKLEPLKRLPAFFRSDGLTMSQHEATSADGTRIPYFLVTKKGLVPNGQTPTLLYGYGGFEISLAPFYAATWGAAWLERGGALAVANIRGGGEFGPAWHQAALRENRPRAYQDFIAVAEDLIRRKITRSEKLGIMGGSNGGLLVGNMLTRRPDLFGAVVCQVPLLDMRRYRKLLAGASWMEEYGDPDDPRQWEFIRTFSPYHNLKAGVRYPRTLFTTSTRDDRVHPGHARKMAARMKELGQDVLYFENTAGGHAGAATNKQKAHIMALEFAFLARQLGLR